VGQYLGWILGFWVQDSGLGKGFGRHTSLGDDPFKHFRVSGLELGLGLRTSWLGLRRHTFIEF
jgi:hypothetical protein